MTPEQSERLESFLTSLENGTYKRTKKGQYTFADHREGTSCLIGSLILHAGYNLWDTAEHLRAFDEGGPLSDTREWLKDKYGLSRSIQVKELTPQGRDAMQAEGIEIDYIYTLLLDNINDETDWDFPTQAAFIRENMEALMA